MLYLSIIMIIPAIYSLLIPIIIKPLTFRGTLYYYMCLIMYFILGLPVNLLTYSYALLHMDVIKWGKTRAIENVMSINVDNSSESTISFVDDVERIPYSAKVKTPLKGVVFKLLDTMEPALDANPSGWHSTVTVIKTINIDDTGYMRETDV